MKAKRDNCEQILVLIKPDALLYSLTGFIIERISAVHNPVIAAAKVVRVTQELAEEHYAMLKDKPFFEDLIKYIMGDYHKKKVMALVYWGDDAINKVRQICGSTNPEEADPVSIRGAYGRITTKGVYENVIHASANEADAEREIKLWFQPDDIIAEMYPVKTVKKSGEQRVWA